MKDITKDKFFSFLESIGSISESNHAIADAAKAAFEACDETQDCFYGVPGVKFIWHGEWADPEVEYEGQKFNYHDLEDPLWSEYQEETGLSDDSKFAEWVSGHKESVYGLLADMAAAG